VLDIPESVITVCLANLPCSVTVLREFYLIPTGIHLFSLYHHKAIYLEIVTNLIEVTFLKAFRRFAAHWSLPHLVLSDNASTYTSAAEELKEHVPVCYIESCTHA